jgi:hypothetical protein
VIPYGSLATKEKQMKKPIEIRRIDSILRLQKKLHAYIPGTYLFEIYDKAIDLATNEDREVNEYFYYNLLRDARRILSRRKQVAPSFVSLLEPDNSEEDEKEAKNPFVSDYFTPEQFVIHTNLITLIRSGCKGIHCYANDVFSDMVDGLLIRESAERIGISESMVKKLRVEIKSLARQVLFN